MKEIFFIGFLDPLFTHSRLELGAGP